MKMYEYDISNSEKWFIDYDYALTLSYDEEAGQWRGNGMLAVTAGGPLPIHQDSSSFYNFGVRRNYIVGDKLVVIATDRAGNTSVAAFEQGEAMGNYVNLAAEKTILDPGETLTIRNTAENQ